MIQLPEIDLSELDLSEFELWQGILLTTCDMLRAKFPSLASDDADVRKVAHHVIRQAIKENQTCSD